MKYAIIPRGDGYISHRGIDTDSVVLPDSAEIYTDRENFQERLSELS